MNPKKSLGQHWLHDETSLNAMVSAGQITDSDVVLEVGPGLGTLTKKLCQVAKQVVAIEKDDILVTQVKNRVGANNFTVEHGDILQYDLASLPAGYKVVANIPYYLTSNLIRIMLESDNPPHTMVLLIQKEVAERIVAEPGQMSILAVSVQYYADAELRELVPAELFTPPPKVDSQIVQIKLRPEPLFIDVKTEDFFKVVKAGFSEKRKKLRSSLSGGLHISKEQVDQWLQTAEVSGDARAQELTLQDWYRLTKTAIL